MAFRASSAVKSDALDEIKSIAVRMKSYAQQVRNSAAAGDISAQVILSVAQQAKVTLDRWATLTAIPGLGAYAADQESDVTYDVLAEYTTMRNALIAVRDRIVTTLPTATAPASVVGRLAIATLAADGSVVFDTYTITQTANLRNDLDAFIASVS